jgi:hypothetical protein
MTSKATPSKAVEDDEASSWAAEAIAAVVPQTATKALNSSSLQDPVFTDISDSSAALSVTISGLAEDNDVIALSIDSQDLVPQAFDPLSSSQLLLAPNDPLDSAVLVQASTQDCLASNGTGTKSAVRKSRHSVLNTEGESLSSSSADSEPVASKRTRKSVLKPVDSVQEVTAVSSQPCVSSIQKDFDNAEKAKGSKTRKTRESVKIQEQEEKLDGASKSAVFQPQSASNKKRSRQSETSELLHSISENQSGFEDERQIPAQKTTSRARKSLAVVREESESVPSRRTTRHSIAPIFADPVLDLPQQHAAPEDSGSIEIDVVKTTNKSDSAKPGTQRAIKRASVAPVPALALESIPDLEGQTAPSRRSRKSLAQDSDSAVQIVQEPLEDSKTKRTKTRRTADTAVGVVIPLEIEVPQVNSSGLKSIKRRKTDPDTPTEVAMPLSVSDSSKSIIKSSRPLSTSAGEEGDDVAEVDGGRRPTKKVRRAVTAHVSIGSTTEYAITPRKISSQVFLPTHPSHYVFQACLLMLIFCLVDFQCAEEDDSANKPKSKKAKASAKSSKSDQTDMAEQSTRPATSVAKAAAAAAAPSTGVERVRSRRSVGAQSEIPTAAAKEAAKPTTAKESAKAAKEPEDEPIRHSAKSSAGKESAKAAKEPVKEQEVEPIRRSAKTAAAKETAKSAAAKEPAKEAEKEPVRRSAKGGAKAAKEPEVEPEVEPVRRNAKASSKAAKPPVAEPEEPARRVTRRSNK